MSRTLADLLDEYDYDKIPEGILVENQEGERFRTGAWHETGLPGEFEDNAYAHLWLYGTSYKVIVEGKIFPVSVKSSSIGIYENQYDNYTIVEDED